MSRVVDLVYFKPSGKYYSQGSYTSDLEWDYQIYGEIRKWGKGSLSLPGLISTEWDGYILVTPKDGVPALIDCGGEQKEI